MPEHMSEVVGSLDFRQFARFIAVGLLNSAFGYTLFAGAVLAGLAPELALLLATVLGCMFNFLTTGRLVFANRNGSLLPRFVAVYASIYALNALTLRMLVEAGLSPLYAQPLILPFAVVCTYGAMRRFVFQDKTR